MRHPPMSPARETRLLLMAILGLQCVILSLIFVGAIMWFWTIMAIGVFVSAGKMLLDERRIRSARSEDAKEEWDRW